MKSILGDNFPVYEMGGLLAAGYSLYQAKANHEDELSRARQHHEESLRLAREQHARNLAEVKRTYLLELFNNLEQHFQQLNADLIASSKESERDMFDQRNQSFQTIILASSVMFTSLSTAIINGMIPFDASESFVIGYSLTTSLSFAFLFLSVVVCIELVLRASSFMYRRAHKQTESLRDAIDKTKDMMRRLRSRNARGAAADDEKEKRCREAKKSEKEQASDAKEGAGKESRRDSARAKPVRSIVRMEEKELQEEWTHHEIEIQNYLAERERINDATAVVVQPFDGDAQSTKKSFQQFWNESCKFWAELGILFFYAGTLNLLLSIMIFMWTQFFLSYKSFISAVIAVALISLSLVLGIIGVMVARMLQANQDRTGSERRYWLWGLSQEGDRQRGSDCEGVRFSFPHSIGSFSLYRRNSSDSSSNPCEQEKIEVQDV